MWYNMNIPDQYFETDPQNISVFLFFQNAVLNEAYFVS